MTDDNHRDQPRDQPTADEAMMIGRLMTGVRHLLSDVGVPPSIQASVFYSLLMEQWVLQAHLDFPATLAMFTTLRDKLTYLLEATDATDLSHRAAVSADSTLNGGIEVTPQ